ncbi:MAG: pilus assembly protein [Gemmataceae bacterium]|nr:pilus assembly protein [Gemmataceae bacterium]
MRQLRPVRRRGATLVEGAIVLSAFLLLILGVIDLGMGVLRYHVVAQAARAGARQAIVHGNQTPRATSSWGPSTITVKGDDTSSEVSNAIRPYLTGLNPANVDIKVEWPAGTNDMDAPVRVTVTTSHQPMLLFDIAAIPLTASSTMRIAF